MTPYYNQLVSEFNSEMYANSILKQHFDYFIQMKDEEEQLCSEFDKLKTAELDLVNRLKSATVETEMLENKAKTLDHTVSVKLPTRIKDLSDKADTLNNVIRSKDDIIADILNEIAKVKNEKDDL